MFLPFLSPFPFAYPFASERKTPTPTHALRFSWKMFQKNLYDSVYHTWAVVHIETLFFSFMKNVYSSLISISSFLQSKDSNFFVFFVSMKRVSFSNSFYLIIQIKYQQTYKISALSVNCTGAYKTWPSINNFGREDLSTLVNCTNVPLFSQKYEWQ